MAKTMQTCRIAPASLQVPTFRNIHFFNALHRMNDCGSRPESIWNGYAR